MTWTEGTEKHARAHKTFRQRHFRRAFGLAKMFLVIYFFAMLSLATPCTVRVREWNCARHFLDSVKTSHKCFCQNCLHYFTFLEVKRNIYQLPNTSNTLVKVRVQTAFFWSSADFQFTCQAPTFLGFGAARWTHGPLMVARLEWFGR